MSKPKKEKKVTWKSIYNKAYTTWKDVCFLRDGRECQVKKYYPEYYGMIHTDILQVDHCFSRGNKWLHLYPKNGTVVCSACNSGKHWNNSPSGILIAEIVKKREGQVEFDKMLYIYQKKEPHIYWKKKEYMEEKLNELLIIKEYYEKRREEEKGKMGC